MKILPASPRTLVPIRVETGGHSVAVIVSLNGQEQFRVTPDASGTATFWLARPGDYQVTEVTASGELSQPLHVAEQVFLSFPIEFGAFSAALLLAGGGLIVWFRNRKKAGSSSVSLPSSFSRESP